MMSYGSEFSPANCVSFWTYTELNGMMNDTVRTLEAEIWPRHAWYKTYSFFGSLLLAFGPVRSKGSGRNSWRTANCGGFFCREARDGLTIDPWLQMRWAG